MLRPKYSPSGRRGTSITHPEPSAAPRTSNPRKNARAGGRHLAFLSRWGQPRGARGRGTSHGTCRVGHPSGSHWGGGVGVRAPGWGFVQRDGARTPSPCCPPATTSVLRDLAVPPSAVSPCPQRPSQPHRELWHQTVPSRSEAERVPAQAQSQPRSRPRPGCGALLLSVPCSRRGWRFDGRRDARGRQILALGSTSRGSRCTGAKRERAGGFTWCPRLGCLRRPSSLPPPSSGRPCSASAAFSGARTSPPSARG